ncbi:DcaP family trimeric outer membrane transporter [Pseudomonadota bacterium]
MSFSQTKKKLVYSGIATILMTTSSPTFSADSEVAVLKEQIRILVERVQKLESTTAASATPENANYISNRRRSGQAKGGTAVVTGNTPGSININGADVTIGGYIKGDFIWDSKFDMGDTHAGRNIPMNPNTPENVHFRAHARQSRFYIDIRKMLENGKKFRTHLEADFFGAPGNEVVSNSHSLRLRHAYGDYGNIRIGQTWSNFMQFFTRAPQLNFASSAGLSFIRQTGIRYTVNKFAVALENPENLIANLTPGSSSVESIPDLVGRWSDRFGPVQLGVSGILTSIKVDGGGVSDTTTGWGVKLGGALHFNKRSKIVASTIIADGANRYIADGFAAPHANLVNGSLVTTEAIGWHAGFVHKVNKNSVFSVSAGGVDFDNAPNGRDKDGIAHINYIWTPAQSVRFGAEVSYAWRKDEGTSTRNNTRIQFSGQYFFDKT